MCVNLLCLLSLGFSRSVPSWCFASDSMNVLPFFFFLDFRSPVSDPASDARVIQSSCMCSTVACSIDFFRPSSFISRTFFVYTNLIFLRLRRDLLRLPLRPVTNDRHCDSLRWFYLCVLLWFEATPLFSINSIHNQRNACSFPSTSTIVLQAA
jgi:hypothetical protein